MNDRIHKQIELLIYFTAGAVFVLFLAAGIFGTPEEALYVTQSLLPAFIPVLTVLGTLRWIYARRVPGGNKDGRWAKLILATIIVIIVLWGLQFA